MYFDRSSFSSVSDSMNWGTSAFLYCQNNDRIMVLALGHPFFETLLAQIVFAVLRVNGLAWQLWNKSRKYGKRKPSL